MKNFILFLVLAMSTYASGQGSIRFRIEILKPHGFRAVTANFPGLESIQLEANVNQNITAGETGQYSGKFVHQNDQWVYENPSAILNKHDTLHYYCLVETDVILIDGYGKFKV